MWTYPSTSVTVSETLFALLFYKYVINVWH